MKPTSIYIVGEPGVGKTTISLELASKYTINPPIRLHKQLWGQPLTKGHIVKGILLGKPKPPFSGTDALGMSVSPDACQWVAQQTTYRLIIGEGARLTNTRFLQTLKDHTNLNLIYLTADNAADRRQNRQKTNGTKQQNPNWVQGRATAARNTTANLTGTCNIITINTTTLSPCTIAQEIHQKTTQNQETGTWPHEKMA